MPLNKPVLPRPTLNAIAGLPLDRHERRAAAELLRVQAAGERIALAGAQAQAGLAPTAAERRCLRRQARQEQLHAVVFEHAAQALDTQTRQVARRPDALSGVRERLSAVLARQDYAGAVTIQHVALEGLGHAVLELLGRELAVHSRAFDATRRLILRHEDAHVAFGAGVLRPVVGQRQIRQLIGESLDAAEQVMQSLSTPFAVLGGDIADVIEPLRSQTQRLLAGGTA